MQTANFVEALQQDLRELAQIGGDDLVESARRLEGAVKQSATLRLIDLLTQAALELSEQLPSGHVDLRIAAQEPQLVYVEEAAVAGEAPAQRGAGAPPRLCRGGRSGGRAGAAGRRRAGGAHHAPPAGVAQDSARSG